MVPNYPKLIPRPVAYGGDKADIPEIGSFGELSYTQGFPEVTQTPLAAGGVPPRRIDFNGIFNELSQHIHYQQSGGQYEWSEELSYLPNALVMYEGKQYCCLQACGKDSETVLEPSSNPSYWLPTAYSNPLLYPSAFVTLYEQEPPARFAVRDGSLIYHASTSVPLLYEALRKEENVWKVKTEAQWQAMRAANPWYGIGGVPFFVLDINANTIRLPDTRGMYEEGAGFDGLTVGCVHGDMIRNITGTLEGSTLYFGDIHPSQGAFYAVNGGPHGSGTGGFSQANNKFDASRVVTTGNANKPRAFGTLHCVYLG